MDRRFIPDEDLARFIAKCEALQKEEGFTIADLSRRFGLHRNTIRGRFRLWREKDRPHPKPSV